MLASSFSTAKAQLNPLLGVSGKASPAKPVHEPALGICWEQCEVVKIDKFNT
jgi:hypothetical protein